MKKNYNPPTMIEFYYVLIKINGDVIHNIFATSHKDLIYKYITPDDEKNNTFFKAIYTPKDNYRLDDLENYHLIICESYIPDWFNGKLKENIYKKLNNIIKSMIIKGRRQLLLHEGAILTKNARIGELKHSVIFAMYDKANIKILDNNSEIHLITDDCSIDEMRDSTRIEDVDGFVKIFEMHNYSKIINLKGHAKVYKMFENSRIVTVKNDAYIEEMHEMSHADRLKHMSKVDEMHGHSVIEEMWDYSLVEKMFDNARINYMGNDSKVKEMYGDSMIEYMGGNSIVEKLCENSLVRKLEQMAKILQKELDK